jgi:hypothetical protein
MNMLFNIEVFLANIFHKYGSKMDDFLGRFGSLSDQISLVWNYYDGIRVSYFFSMAMFGEIAVPPNGTHFLLMAMVVVAILVGKLFDLARLPALLVAIL